MRRQPQTILLRFLFLFSLTIFLCIALVACIRRQKYHKYLQTLSTRNEALAPDVRVKSRKIVEAFTSQNFVGLRGLMDGSEETKRALYDYSWSDRPHLIELIIQRKCVQSLQIVLETRVVDPNKTHLLHSVIYRLNGHANLKPFIEILVANGADLDLADKEGFPPVAHTIIHRNVAALKLLIKHGAELNVAFYQNDSFLHFAVSQVSDLPDIVKTLILGGANAFHRGADGLTAFHRSIVLHPQWMSLARVFLDTVPADFSREQYLHSILHHPSATSIAQVKTPATHTRYGYSPLHWAVAYSHTQLVRLLLQRGADQTFHDCDGVTPLQLAQALRHWEIPGLLINASQRNTYIHN